MANLGVFNWIREGVRRSVLLGFSDAVEQLGATADGQETLHPQLAAILCDAPAAGRISTSPTPSAKRERKRLGRSLEQLRRANPGDGHQ